MIMKLWSLGFFLLGFLLIKYSGSVRWINNPGNHPPTKEITTNLTLKYLGIACFIYGGIVLIRW
jgi:hypothetical protein